MAEVAEAPTDPSSQKRLTRPGQGGMCRAESANPQLLTKAEPQEERFQTIMAVIFGRGSWGRICIDLMPDATLPRPSGRVWNKIRLVHIRRSRRPMQSTFDSAWLGLGLGPSRRQLSRH